MHHCANVVCGPEGDRRPPCCCVPARSSTVSSWPAYAAPAPRDRDLARGPGPAVHGPRPRPRRDGARPRARGASRLELGDTPDPKSSPPAPAWGCGAPPSGPWRFWLTGERTVSVYRPAAARPPRHNALTCGNSERSDPDLSAVRTRGLMFHLSPQAASETPASPAGSSGFLHARRVRVQPRLTRLDPRPVSYCRLSQDKIREVRTWVRLMFENSTVCHSRRISLLCPVTMALIGRGGGFFGYTIISDKFVSDCSMLGDVALFSSCWPFGLVWGLFFDGEFDPGSGRTLAACLTHASRAERPLRWYSSGERVSNT